MAPNPPSTKKATLGSWPWKTFTKMENLLDAGINEKYQDNVFGGFYPLFF